jgi:hypothetical protein
MDIVQIRGVPASGNYSNAVQHAVATERQAPVVQGTVVESV